MPGGLAKVKINVVLGEIEGGRGVWYKIKV